MALALTLIIFVGAQFLLQILAIRWDTEFSGLRGIVMGCVRVGTLIPFYWVARSTFPGYGLAIALCAALIVPPIVVGTTTLWRRRHEDDDLRAHETSAGASDEL